jgi:hypothetical protein
LLVPRPKKVPVRRSLTLASLLVLVALGSLAGPAAAAELPSHGFIVFKDTLRGEPVVEVRDDFTGRVVTKLKHPRRGWDFTGACGDPHFRPFARWKKSPKYFVNAASIPDYLDATLARAELVRAQEAWEKRFRTDCRFRLRSGFNAKDRGDTSLDPTTVTQLEIDRVNVVGWVSLEGTVCDGALACVVADFDQGRIFEADLGFERDLTRYGFQDFWTTSRTTFTTPTGGQFAISDVGTHEFGHFLGLDHVPNSPELTMYTFIHDGDDTLGLGDMLGAFLLYH